MFLVSQNGNDGYAGLSPSLSLRSLYYLSPRSHGRLAAVKFEKVARLGLVRLGLNSV